MINSSDILQLCRLCLVEDAVNHSIFEESGDLRSIFLKISSCLPVSIHKDDGLPEKICDSCSTKLDSFYQFWNETANAEKQLLQWLKQTTTKKQNQAETSKKMDTTEIKQEEIDESNMDPIDMSSDAQTYILQQQQLPYASVPTDSINTSESDEPLSKRPKRASAMRALEQMESEDEDDPDLAPDNYAKTESDDSDKDEEEDANHQENPSTTSMEEQPGPSGIVKKRVVLDDTPTSTKMVKPCHVVLNEIKELLDEDGFYIVPGRSRRALTCYRCFKKFYSAEALEVHKAEHEPESGEEDVFAVSDSEIEIEIESESDEDERKNTEESVVKRNSKSPSKKRAELLMEKKAKVEATENPIEYVPKPPEPPQTKQIQVVEPIMGKPKTVIGNVSSPQVNKSTPQTTDAKKVPVLCNIQIKCLGCDVLFTNSELLMQHKAVDASKPCCFTCKVCTESYTQAADYLEHIMQHNTFSSSRYGNRGGAARRRPEFRCTYCQKEFEHRFLLNQHEEREHKQELQALKKHEVMVVAETEPPKVAIPPKPIETVQNPRYILVKPKEIIQKPREIAPKPEENTASKSNEQATDSSEESADSTKPKIWVIKEALIKSPEPPISSEQKSVVGSMTAKRKLEQLEKLQEMIKPAKRGRPAKTANMVVLNPGFSAPAKQVTSLTCDECFDVFQTKAAFDEHMVFHEANKDGVVVSTSNSDGGAEFPCNLCNMQFKSVAGLRRHQSCIHEKMTSFVCNKCSKIFSSRKGLNIHRSFCTATSS